MKQSLSRYVLTPRSSSEPSIRLTRDEREWARKRAGIMIKAIEETNVKVIGDLNDLMPAEPTDKDPLTRSEATEPEVLDAALDGMVGLGRILGDVRIAYDRLLRAIDHYLPAPTEAEKAEFDATEEAQTPAPPNLPRDGRLVVWRLAQIGSLRKAHAAGRHEHEDDDENEDDAAAERADAPDVS
jgi:hypothetical protein